MFGDEQPADANRRIGDDLFLAELAVGRYLAGAGEADYEHPKDDT